MFGSDHYVPVLRWKRGEQKAMRFLEPADKDALTPLIEIPPDDFLPGNVGMAPDTSGLIRRLSTTLELAIGARTAFVDFGLLAYGGIPIEPAGAITQFFELLDGGGVTAVPVTGVARPESYQAATRPIAMQRRALALRQSSYSLRIASARGHGDTGARSLACRQSSPL